MMSIQNNKNNYCLQCKPKRAEHIYIYNSCDILLYVAAYLLLCRTLYYISCVRARMAPASSSSAPLPSSSVCNNEAREEVERGKYTGLKFEVWLRNVIIIIIIVFYLEIGGGAPLSS